MEYISKPLTFICNQSLQPGIFPNNMKITKVIPFYKNGNKHIFSNYRPYSLLPQFSKILEKLFVVRLNHFLEKHSLLTDHLYGYKSNGSTAMAFMELTEQISSAIDKKDIWEYTSIH